jgi:hypothetical protein
MILYSAVLDGITQEDGNSISKTFSANRTQLLRVSAEKQNRIVDFKSIDTNSPLGLRTKRSGTAKVTYLAESQLRRSGIDRFRRGSMSFAIGLSVEVMVTRAA